MNQYIMCEKLTPDGTKCYIRLILTILRNVFARQLENTHCSLKTEFVFTGKGLY